MTDIASLDAYGVLTERATLKIQRLLPGPIERVWAYLTQSDLRRKWLAAGDMEMTVGAPFELVWRNSELTNPPGQRPPGKPTCPPWTGCQSVTCAPTSRACGSEPAGTNGSLSAFSTSAGTRIAARCGLAEARAQ